MSNSRLENELNQLPVIRREARGVGKSYELVQTANRSWARIENPNPVFEPHEAGDLPILVYGGDHPNDQWWGTNGQNGRAKLFMDRRLPWYIAINLLEDDPNGEGVGGTGRMTWAQLRYLQDRGCEITSHGNRHIGRWNKIASGITVAYIGAGTGCTLSLSSSAPRTLTTSVTGGPGGENLNLDLTNASYDTVSELVAALNAFGSGSVYRARAAGELLGTEQSKNLVPITSVQIRQATLSASPDASSATGTATFLVGRNLAISTGIVVQYHQTEAASNIRTASIEKTSGNKLNLYEDGVLVVQYDLTNASFDTLTEVVAAIDARSNWDAALCDNGYTVDGTQGSANNNYCLGTELSVGLNDTETSDCTNKFVRIDMGLPSSYIISRCMQRVVDVAAQNGVYINAFQQSGGDFYPWLPRGVGIHNSYRGDSLSRSSVQPMQLPAYMAGEAGSHVLYRGMNTSMSYAKVKAYLDAMVDSGPFIWTSLAHMLTPDPANVSGLNLQSSANATADFTEAVEVPFLNYLQGLRDQGKIEVLTPSQAYKAARLRRKPQNYVFNPRFINSGDTLSGITSDGERLPGWIVTSTGTTLTYDATDSSLTIVGTAGQLLFIKQDVQLEPGETYIMGCTLIFLGGGTVTNGVRIGLQTRRGRWKNLRLALSNYITSAYRKTTGELSFLYTHPNRGQGFTGYIKGLNQEPFNLSTNKNIRLSIDALGNSTDIDCSVGGASAAGARTAYDVANAINAALLTDVTYGGASPKRTEYATIARAENGRVILQAPFRHGSGASQNVGMRLVNGSTADACNTIFGSVAANVSLGEEYLADPSQPNEHPMFFAIEANNIAGESVKVLRPYIQLWRPY